MLKQLLTVITTVTLAASFAATPVLAATCDSASDCVTQGVNGAGGTGASSTDVPTLVKNIVNILLFIIGAVSVVMVVMGGIKYAVSNGDSSQVKSAKDTILYAVIGLVVALLAYALVNWVVQAFIS